MQIERYDIKILKDGTWLYGGTPITRHNLVKLFAGVLSRDAEGLYWLKTPYEQGIIEVENTPFLVVEMDYDGKVLRFRTNLDEWVEVNTEHPLHVEYQQITAAPSITVMIRSGLEALLTRAVYYELINAATPSPDNKDVLGLWSNGNFYPIGSISPC